MYPVVKCIAVCPTGALYEKDNTDEIFAAIADPDKYVDCSDSTGKHWQADRYCVQVNWEKNLLGYPDLWLPDEEGKMVAELRQVL